MRRALIITAFVTLTAFSSLLAWCAEELYRELQEADSRLSTLSHVADQLTLQLRGAGEQIELLKAASTNARHQPAQAQSLDPVAQLTVAQSVRIDRIVEWVGLIEEKIFFILFPPGDPTEKERKALELRGRTEQIRAQFQAVAQQEQVLREQVLRKLKAQQPTNSEQ